jgi:hypothetical protein
MLASMATITAVALTVALIVLSAIFDNPPTEPTPGELPTSATSFTSLHWWKIGVGFAVFVVGVAGNLVANAFQKSIDAMPRDTVTAMKNHNLADLVGESVRVVLLLLVDSKPPPEGLSEGDFPHSVTDAAKPPLTDMATFATEFWRALVLDPDTSKAAPFAGLHEPTLSKFIINPMATAMNRESWSKFLDQLHSFAQTRTSRNANDFPINEDRYAATDALEGHFGRSFREALKWDSTHDGLGWAAMQLQIAGQLLERAGNAKGASQQTNDALEGLQGAYSEGIEAFKAQLKEMEAANADRHEATLARLDEQHSRVMGELKDLSVQVGKVGRDATIAAEQATAAEKAALRAAEASERIEKDLKGLAPAADTRPTANLTAASATKNDNFKGRKEQLQELTMLVQNPKGPIAVAIVAGAGFGKTELAKEFVNAHSRPAPPGTDFKVLAADEWTGRWWLDGSKDGEVASLRKHYEAITGEKFPDEPRLSRGEDSEKSAAKFRTMLRGRIAAACSRGKQLLVIDNAETPEQILEYKPANRGRLIATTRRQQIASAIAHEFPLDVMSASEARELLIGRRHDLRDPSQGKDLDEIATHLGHHALALAYAAAALDRPPHKTPQETLEALKSADVGDDAHILSEFDEQELGTKYKFGLARSLGLLLDELANTDSREHDPLALTLANLMAFCNPAAIPLDLLEDASCAWKADVEKSLRALHERSIITLTQTASMHRLTQSLLRGRMKRQGNSDGSAPLGRLLEAALKLHEENDHDEIRPRRTAAAPHITTAADWALAEVGVNQYLAAWCHARSATHLMLIGDLATAESAINKAVRWAESGGDDLAEYLMVFLCARAGIRRLRGLLKEAEEDIDRAIRWISKQDEEYADGLSLLYLERASIRQDLGLLKEAEEDIAWSINWQENQPPRDERHRALSYAYALRASIRKDLRLLKEAAKDIARSINWQENQSPLNERALAVLYASRARIRQDLGLLKEAEEDIAWSINWEENQSPLDERSLAVTYASRASIRRDLGLLTEAAEDIARAIKWGEEQSPRNKRDLACDYTSRASIRQDLGLLTEAAEDIDLAIEWGEEQSPRDERNLAIRYATRASIRRDMKQFAAARADIDAALKWWLANLPHDERRLSSWREIKASIDAAERR